MAKLGEVCTIVSGSTPKTSVTSYWDGNIKWITPAELNEDTFYIMDSVRHITEEGKEKTGLSYLPTGTVILSSRAPIGKAAIAGCEMCCNQGFKNLICSDAIYNEYLYFFLKSKTDYLNSLGRGATFKEISKSIVENIEIPLPEVNQQKEIAEKFKKLEQLISLRKQQLAKLDELVKARFANIFENNADFHTDYMENLSEFVTVGIANSATHAYAEHGIVMLRNQNIKENHLDDTELVYIEPKFADKYKSKKLEANDILVTRTGYPGIACVVPQKYAGSQTFTTLIIRLKKETSVSSCYICHYINSSHGKKYVSGTKVGVAQQNFGAKVLAKMPVVIPPINLQNDFAVFVERVDQQKQTVQKSLEKLELMKKALMQEYFG